jgi:phospholipid/cholesterol/gamma-HCH transport system substrate-binding protein
LSSTFSNLSSVTDNLKKNNEDISSVLHNFAIISDSLKQSDLKKLIHNADETFAKTSVLFAKIDSGQGTAGQLMVNDSLYRNLNSAVASLDSLLIDLKDHPGRYVRVSVFGKKEKY